MNLSALARAAAASAESLDYDATKWHRVELAARAAIRRQALERRRLERASTVRVPTEDEVQTPNEENEESCRFDLQDPNKRIIT
jgi:hypothetical protein